MSDGERIAQTIQDMISLTVSMSDGRTAFSFNPAAQLRDLQTTLAKLIDAQPTPRDGGRDG